MVKAAVFHKGLKLIEEELGPETINCPICGHVERCRIIDIQNNPTVTLCQCMKCHSVSASRMPKSEILEKYYSQYYDENENKVTVDNADKFSSHLFNIFSNYITNSVTLDILDFGGGNGSISLKLAEKIYKKTGKNINISLIDINKELLPLDNPKISIVHHYQLDEIKDKVFDFVIASAIIEHIPHPAGELFRIFELLKKNGVFYARTPYMLPFLKLFRKIGIHFDFTFPAHVHDLNNYFWENITQTLNIPGKYKILLSRPSLIETTFKKNFIRTSLAYLIKMPWYILKNNYRFIGGCEIFIQKTEIN